MTKVDACNFLGIKPGTQITEKLVKAKYREASKKWHPDLNPKVNDTMMKMVTEAKTSLLSNYLEQTAPKQYTTSDYPEKVAFALSKVLDLDGVSVEVTGNWLWVHGNSYPHRAILKEASFRWAPKKKSWYFRPAEYRSFNKKEYSMDKIRNIYGSEQVVKDQEEKKEASGFLN